MTSNVINLRQARKARERQNKEREAAESRHTHGLKKQDRERIAIERANADKRMDGLKRGEAIDDPDVDPGNVS